MNLIKKIMAVIGFLVAQEYIANGMEHDCSYCQVEVGASKHGSTGKDGTFHE